jgi:hypothetical protein
MFMTKKIFNYVLSIVFLSMCLTLIPASFDFQPVNQTKAAGWWDTVNNNEFKQVGSVYGNNTTKDIRMVVVDIIKKILGLLGVIALVIILYAGFKWMTSAGNEETITSAKKTLIAGLIGLAIILFSYAIATFVIKYLSAASTGQQVIW